MRGGFCEFSSLSIIMLDRTADASSCEGLDTFEDVPWPILEDLFEVLSCPDQRVARICHRHQCHVIVNSKSECRVDSVK